jgi:RND superfamily putative drug exporter
MKLLGDANWWLPAWLDRRLPRVDIDGESGLPAPEREAGADGAPHAVPAGELAGAGR